jgi:hypothetical protein
VRIHHTGAGWAFLASVGAAYFVSSLAMTILGPLLQWIINLDQVLNHLTFPPPPVGIGIAATWGLSVALGAFVGIGVARVASGTVAAALYASFIAVTAGIEVARAIAQHEQAINGFTVVSVGNVPVATALMFLPAGLALVAGWAASGRVRPGPGRANGALECAGAYALVAVAGSTLSPYADLLTGPYSAVYLDSQRHGAIVLAQSLAAGAVYAMRAPRPLSYRALIVFGLIGLAGVLPTDVMPILFTLFLHWTYIPLSLIVVPLATALLGLITVGASRLALGRTNAASG